MRLNMVENDTSCRDIQTFFKKLFVNKIAPEALTKEMMGYMENTDFEDRLPRFLPRNLHVYHKTGDGVNFIHDGGIISNGNTPFILIVTSSNLTDEEEAKVTIGKIAEKIFLDRGKK